MEEKISKIATRIVGGSYLAAGLLIVLLFGIASIASRDFDVVKSPFMIKAFVISTLYILSVVLLVTLPGKDVIRRSISWGFSICFHAGFLVYLAVFNDFGSVAFLLGLVESLILSLSIVGLGVLVYNQGRRRA